MIVTPVRADSPSIMVAYPTVTPEMSVIALNVPVLPSNGIPKSRARSFVISFPLGKKIGPEEKFFMAYFINKT
jgi:hypothetical protein